MTTPAYIKLDGQGHCVHICPEGFSQHWKQLIDDGMSQRKAAKLIHDTMADTLKGTPSEALTPSVGSIRNTARSFNNMKARQKVGPMDPVQEPKDVVSSVNSNDTNTFVSNPYAKADREDDPRSKTDLISKLEYFKGLVGTSTERAELAEAKLRENDKEIDSLNVKIKNLVAECDRIRRQDGERELERMATKEENESLKEQLAKCLSETK